MPRHTLITQFIEALKQCRFCNKDQFLELRNLICYYYLTESISYTSEFDFIRRLAYGRHETVSESDYVKFRLIRKNRDSLMWFLFGRLSICGDVSSTDKNSALRVKATSSSNIVSDHISDVEKSGLERTISKKHVETFVSDGSSSYFVPLKNKDTVGLPNHRCVEKKSSNGIQRKSITPTKNGSIRENVQIESENFDLNSSNGAQERNPGSRSEPVFNATSVTCASSQKRSLDVSSTSTEGKQRYCAPALRRKRDAENQVNTEPNRPTMDSQTSDKQVEMLKSDIGKNTLNILELSKGFLELQKVLECVIPPGQLSNILLGSGKSEDDDQEWRPDAAIEAQNLLNGSSSCSSKSRKNSKRKGKN